MALWQNPEFIRNVRAQMRPARLAGAAVIIALLSWVSGYAMHETATGRPNPEDWAKSFMGLALGVQLAVLGIGGGLACALSIHRERERNTFDFQRVTRLTPAELALGKLFGAPVFYYFLAACLMPAAIVGAIAGHVRVANFLAGLMIILLGCVVFHALGLLLSLARLPGGSGVPGALLFLFLPILALPASETSSLKPPGPWVGVQFALEGTWRTESRTLAGTTLPANAWTDLVYGWPVHHVAVVLILYLTLLFWLLLASARNLKRDVSEIELYSPAQSVGLLCYMNLVVLAFYAPQVWQMMGSGGPIEINETVQLITTLNLILLYFLGATLLRNRDQSRRRVYELGTAGPGWQEALWPTGYLIAAGALVVIIVSARLSFLPGPVGKLNLGMTAFQMVFLAAMLVRDLLYFQWMNLRRSRYPLAMAALFLGVYYTCGGILVNTLDWIGASKHTFLTAAILPWSALLLDRESWTGMQAGWMAILGVQAAICALFAWLHYRKLAEMAPSRPVGHSSTASAATSGA